MYQLDTKEHAKSIEEYAYKKIIKVIFSVDNFLYVCCFVVTNGKGYFEEVLKNPKKMPKDIDFEYLFDIEEHAYELIMNK